MSKHTFVQVSRHYYKKADDLLRTKSLYDATILAKVNPSSFGATKLLELIDWHLEYVAKTTGEEKGWDVAAIVFERVSEDVPDVEPIDTPGLYDDEEDY